MDSPEELSFLSTLANLGSSRLEDMGSHCDIANQAFCAFILLGGVVLTFSSARDDSNVNKKLLYPMARFEHLNVPKPQQVSEVSSLWLNRAT